MTEHERKHLPGTCAQCGARKASRGVGLCKLCDIVKRKSPQTRQEYRRSWHIRNKYGMDDAEFEAWWIVFKGKCGICGSELKMPTLTRGQALDVVAIDHDHTTGRVRGLLCNGCNKGIGLLREDVNILKNAIDWINNAKTRNT